jgi:cytoskeletal protein RodZ
LTIIIKNESILNKSKINKKDESIMNENHKPEKSEKKIHKLRKKENQAKLLFGLLVVLLLIGLAFVLMDKNNSDSEQNNGNGNENKSTYSSDGNAKLYLKPSNEQVNAGSSVTFEVWVDTGDKPVNAVQANLTYPVDKFDFSSISANGSAFEIQAVSTGANGKISIARGHIGDLKGPNLVAKVVLTAKSSKGDAQVSFAADSAVVTSTDHKNILKDKTGSTFKISKTLSPVAYAQIKRAG